MTTQQVVTTRFALLDRSVKQNPKCIHVVFYCKGIDKCLKEDYCKDKFDYDGVKFCKETQKKE